MKRPTRIACGIAAATTLIVAAIPLFAQPQPRPRPAKDDPFRMELPAGRYSSLVFAYAASTTGASLRVDIKAPSAAEDATLLVPPGETVILPVGWNLSRPLVIELDQGTRVFASGITADGPVAFAPIEP